MNTFNLEKQISFGYCLAVIIWTGMAIIIGAAYLNHVLRRRRISIIQHPTVYPIEECAKVRGILVTGMSKFSEADIIRFLPVQQKSTDKGELIFSNV